MDFIVAFLGNAVGFLWGTPLIVLVLGSGALFTIGTGFFQFRHFSYFMGKTFGSLFKKEEHEVGHGHVSAFQAIATAIGGAVGVGNIGGVSTAIAVGGPGALFWLWIAALLGMGLKCAEVTLAVYYRSIDENGEPYGGPTYYIQRGIGQLLPGKVAKIASVLATIFGVGFACNFLSGVQGYTIAEGFTSAFGIDILVFGIIYSIVVWIIVLGGGKRVVEFAGKIVPVMIVFFVAAALGIVIINIKELPGAIALIVKSAFTGTAAVGGFAGAAAKAAIQNGIARSVFSNEAGQGSSTMVHSQAHVNHPVRQGLWGMFEVFMDTMVVCTIMSLAIIVSGQWSSGLEGASLSVSAFGVVYGHIGAKLVAIAILLFGLTTQTGWFMYYDVLLRHALSKNIPLKNKIIKAFRFIYPLPGLLTIFYTVHYGLPTGTVWLVTDFFCAVPTTLNIICVIALSGVYFKLVKDYKARYMGIGEVDPNFKVFYEKDAEV
ncbi:MAG: sodium:alanine symporter family protein [Firmicutes bacterium]|nr:sodium:alanine symporter family protein [Bacillota bacterium]